MTELPQRLKNRIDKEKRFVSAAIKVFAESGYAGATMDAVAKEAGLSKPTLYQYFDGKEQLFAQIMLERRDYMLLFFRDPGQGDMVDQLHDFAWRYADSAMRPELLSLARLTIGEVQRFPEIGRAYQTAGHDKVLQGLMGLLTTHRDAGRLEFDDAELAAQDLWGLILSAPRTQALYIPDQIPSRTELVRYVENGLRVFLRAYSTDPTADLLKLEGLQTPAAQQVTP
jgi:AcrR family transcriptional regulator